eukprot:CAMPEP_0113946134 /NCGR_PEP_ID=MMETSP1339-20121228/54790_1 /TAXON_ID=94617 /ORGANISM="Fibrocapsa japonica" /LENGTH=60 /DNA_ID=CAMNT_0000952063 /DNA_START=208 /DNA_END=390 /DNA_ORIENTATION=- /assembly_acc=CAM_ASM_000762
MNPLILSAAFGSKWTRHLAAACSTGKNDIAVAPARRKNMSNLEGTRHKNVIGTNTAMEYP